MLLTALSNKVHDGPTVLSSLKVIEAQIGQFSSSKTTAEKDGNNCSVALALEGFSIGRLP